MKIDYPRVAMSDDGRRRERRRSRPTIAPPTSRTRARRARVQGHAAVVSRAARSAAASHQAAQGRHLRHPHRADHRAVQRATSTRWRSSNLEVAADYIYMAALLIHIKSKMLLPRDERRGGDRRSAQGARRPPARISALQGGGRIVRGARRAAHGRVAAAAGADAGHRSVGDRHERSRRSSI